MYYIYSYYLLGSSSKMSPKTRPRYYSISSDNATSPVQPIILGGSNTNINTNTNTNTNEMDGSFSSRNNPIARSRFEELPSSSPRNSMSKSRYEALGPPKIRESQAGAIVK